MGYDLTHCIAGEDGSVISEFLFSFITTAYPQPSIDVINSYLFLRSHISRSSSFASRD